MSLAPPALLARLLRDLGSEVRRGGDVREARVELATGIPALDARRWIARSRAKSSVDSNGLVT